jgi:hypothetical protein
MKRKESCLSIPGLEEEYDAELCAQPVVPWSGLPVVVGANKGRLAEGWTAWPLNSPCYNYFFLCLRVYCSPGIVAGALENTELTHLNSAIKSLLYATSFCVFGYSMVIL